jgi:hypothetical protein
MEHGFYPGEFAMLLLVFWGPVFAIAAIVQWRLLTSKETAHRNGRVGALLAASVVQVLLAAAILLSPLHRLLFPEVRFLWPVFSMGGIPFQAGLVAAVVVTGLVWDLEASEGVGCDSAARTG